MAVEGLDAGSPPASWLATETSDVPAELATGLGLEDRRFAGADRGNVIVVLGPPGAGKGTQAALLSERLGFPHVSTGAMLRDRILIGDELGRAIASRIDFGQFVPDEWIERILEDRVSLADCRHGVILDGYPRTLPQAEGFVERMSGGNGQPPKEVFVVRLQATPETLVARFAGRRQCSMCGALFHLRYQPSLAGDACDRPDCLGTLERRLDDRPEFVAGRLADFETLTAPVTDFLQSRVGRMVSVDAVGSPEEILECVLAEFHATRRRNAQSGRQFGGDGTGGRARAQSTLLGVSLEAAPALRHEDRS